MLAAPRATQRILRGVAASLTWSPLDADGKAATPAGTVTATITRADGTAIATGASTSSSGGVYAYALAASNNADLDYLTVSWLDGTTARATTYVEVVGAYYASLAAIRAADEAITPARFSDVKLIEKRWTVEEEFERVAGVAFVPRFRRVRVRCSGTTDLVLPDPMLRTVTSAKIMDGDTVATTLTAGDLADIPADPAGIARWSDSTWTSGYDALVEYEHGFDSPPQDVLDVFWLRIRNRLNASRVGVPDRAVTFAAAEGGTYGLATPGQRGSVTGQPDVDVVLLAYRDHFHAPGIA